jgi:hypothetical protein
MPIEKDAPGTPGEQPQAAEPNPPVQQFSFQVVPALPLNDHERELLIGAVISDMKRTSQPLVDQMIQDVKALEAFEDKLAQTHKAYIVDGKLDKGVLSAEEQKELQRLHDLISSSAGELVNNYGRQLLLEKKESVSPEYLGHAISTLAEQNDKNKVTIVERDTAQQPTDPFAPEKSTPQPGSPEAHSQQKFEEFKRALPPELHEQLEHMQEELPILSPEALIQKFIEGLMEQQKKEQESQKARGMLVQQAPGEVEQNVRKALDEYFSGKGEGSTVPKLALVQGGAAGRSA